ncbi:hypothetical protein APHAL10511_002759 [Amanita phalloides]|nr:hypothetical protein APHAL10511_002759 [Amanita phalloides]
MRKPMYRIISIPLTRPLPPAKSTRILTYYQFQLKQSPVVDSGVNGKGKENLILSRWLPEGGVVNWASTKAVDIWAGFGKQPKGWKRSIYDMGEKIADQLDFEELALRSIDSSKGPKIPNAEASVPLSSPPSSSSSSLTTGKESSEVLKIPLFYPPSICTRSETLGDLRALVSHRIPKHRKGFYFWVLVAPLTTPLVLIPVIPNIPFFFCVWRSWSHYRAYKASQYLETLLEHDMIVPEESQLLNMVYDQYGSRSKKSESENSKDEDGKLKSTIADRDALLLTPGAVPNIARVCSLQTSAETDLHRAMEQARQRKD